MATTRNLSNSGRFFSAFQRYITVASFPQHHIHYQAFVHHHTLRCLRKPRALSRPRYASTSTSTSPTVSHRKPSTPILYDLFPGTLPHGPPPHGPFKIDTRRLRSEFLQLQARAHPDRHTGPNKARAEGTSALINEAYKTLQSPLMRAQYLLSLRGIDVAEDEGLKVEDPELLMEVLEVRERIEAAEEEGELEGFKRVNEERIAESEEVLERAFKEDDVERAMGEAVRLRYWTNVKESLDGWERGKPVVLVH